MRWAMGVGAGIILFSLILLGCTDTVVEPTPSGPVQTNVHLWTGFENRRVQITVDSVLQFHAFLSPAVPLAGPVAIFRSDYARTAHRMIIVRDSCLCLSIPPKRDTVDFTLGESGEYWIGLGVAADTVYMVLQDSAFGYL